MANYIVRVELHSATWDDYERLHASMRRRGYSRIIKSNQGVRYQLPTGTYVAENTPDSLQAALEAATEAAKETGRQSWVVVADWKSARWRGLVKV